MSKAGYNYLRGLATVALISSGGTGTTVQGISALRRLEEGACSGVRLLTSIRSADDRASFQNQADGLFVNSGISDKDIPIGGCYQISDVTTNGFNSSYVLDGGDLVIGKAWLYVNEGTWNIGIVEGDIEYAGEVESTDTICTSTTLAASVSDPTDSQLEGDWTCSYFEGGITNYEVEADFEEVECGCEGKSMTEEDSGDESFGTVTTAIAVLVALAVLAVLVLGCFCFVRRRKSISTQARKPAAPSLQEP